MGQPRSREVATWSTFAGGLLPNFIFRWSFAPIFGWFFSRFQPIKLQKQKPCWEIRPGSTASAGSFPFCPFTPNLMTFENDSFSPSLLPGNSHLDRDLFKWQKCEVDDGNLDADQVGGSFVTTEQTCQVFTHDSWLILMILWALVFDLFHETFWSVVFCTFFVGGGVSVNLWLAMGVS